MTPTEENKDDKVRMGLVQISDGKSKPRPARLVLTMDAVTIQEEVVILPPPKDKTVPNSRERMVQLTRQKVGGLGLSIKGGAEHKLPILISKIYKDQAADQTGQLFVGDAVIKVNGEYITACRHDDAVSILRNAGDIVVLTVKHYRAATPFLMKQAGDGMSDSESLCGEERVSAGEGGAGGERGAGGAGGGEERAPDGSEHTNGGSGWQFVSTDTESRPGSAQPEVTKWKDIVTVPLMMAYVTRYVHGTDKLRPGAMEVRGARPDVTSGVIHIEQPAALSYWLKAISDNILGLTSLQVKLLNRQLGGGGGAAQISHACWVQEAAPAPARGYTPAFLLLRGADLMLYRVPPTTVADLSKCPDVLKVYQTMFRTVKESETVDWRVNCFVIQSSGGVGGVGGAGGPRYFSVETRQQLLRLEAAWTHNVLNCVIKLGKKTFTVVHLGRAACLTLDWASGFSLTEGGPSATPLWTYKFSQLRGSSDDGKSKLKLHFQEADTKNIETKELECQILQSLLFCMHAFLTAKVASVDPAFLASVHQY